MSVEVTGIEVVAAILSIRALPIVYDFFIKFSQRHHERWAVLTGRHPSPRIASVLDRLATVDVSLGFVFSMVATAGTVIQTSFFLGVIVLIWSILALIGVEFIAPRLLHRVEQPSRATRFMAYLAAIVMTLQILFLEAVLEFRFPIF